jgi:ADP-heptose:LPS heptosyltransferase
LLSSQKPKVIYDLTGVMSSASLIFNSKADKIVGINREQFKGIYDQFIPIRTEPHLMDLYLDATGLISSDNEFRLKLKAFPLSKTGGDYILIHPYAGWKAKEWNLNHFILLTIELNKVYKTRFITPAHQLPKDIIMELSNLNIELTQTESVEELINEINESSMIIGNDSGAVNIASLLGKPTFAIYGPTNIEYSVPFGNTHNHIHTEISCIPNASNKFCFTFGGLHGCPAFQCMNLLKFNNVKVAVLNFAGKILN